MRNADDVEVTVSSDATGIGESEIRLLGLDDVEVDGQKGVFGRGGHPEVLAGRVRLGRLAGNVADFCRQANELFAAATAASPALSLESMEVSLAVTAKGEVRLVGAVSGEVSGGITLVFKRRTEA